MNSPRKYRKKPIVIEAMQFDGQNAQDILAWIRSEGGVEEAAYDGHVLVIKTLEGDMVVTLWDWVLKGVRREFYPCKPDIFAATYDPEVAGPDA